MGRWLPILSNSIIIIIHTLYILFTPPLQIHHHNSPILIPHSNAPQTDFHEFPNPGTETTISPDNFSIEKRTKSEIIRDRKSRTGLVKPEPPNFDIGWKRTKPIPLEKPKGYVIMDVLEKLMELMDREFGSAALLAKVGEIVADRAREEAQVLRDPQILDLARKDCTALGPESEGNELGCFSSTLLFLRARSAWASRAIGEGKVEERMLTELSRVLKLMEMDLAMVKAAVKQETLNERLQQARARCRQAVLVANSF